MKRCCLRKLFERSTIGIELDSISQRRFTVPISVGSEAKLTQRLATAQGSIARFTSKWFPSSRASRGLGSQCVGLHSTAGSAFHKVCVCRHGSVASRNPEVAVHVPDDNAAFVDDGRLTETEFRDGGGDVSRQGSLSIVPLSCSQNMGCLRSAAS